MKFRSLMGVAAIVSFLFGAYLLWYGTVVLSGYSTASIPEVAAQDSHGMSLLAGYTLIRMLGALICGQGLLLWFIRNTTDQQTQWAVTLGLLLTNLFALTLALFQQNVFWRTEWGKLYIALFLFLSLCFINGLITSRRK